MDNSGSGSGWNISNALEERGWGTFQWEGGMWKTNTLNFFLIRSLKKHKILSSVFYTAGVSVQTAGNKIFCWFVSTDYKLALECFFHFLYHIKI